MAQRERGQVVGMRELWPVSSAHHGSDTGMHSHMVDDSLEDVNGQVQQLDGAFLLGDGGPFLLFAVQKLGEGFLRTLRVGSHGLGACLTARRGCVIERGGREFRR